MMSNEGERRAMAAEERLRARPDMPAVIANAASLGTLILVGDWAGHPGAGHLAALGALAFGGTRTGGSFPDSVREVAKVGLPAGLAIAAGSLLAEAGAWAIPGFVLLAAVAAVAGGYSRGMAVGAARFVVILAIMLNAALAAGSGGAVPVLGALGAAFAAIIVLVTGTVARAKGFVAQAAEARERPMPATVRLFRFRRALGRPAGWRYAARLVPALALAGAVRTAWPDHHYGWVAITVASLCRRGDGGGGARITRRILGTGTGVLAAGILGQLAVTDEAVAALVGLLGALGAWFRDRSDFAHAASATLLILFLLAEGHPIDARLLTDRLIATAIGASLVALSDAAARLLPEA